MLQFVTGFCGTNTTPSQGENSHSTPQHCWHATAMELGLDHVISPYDKDISPTNNQCIIELDDGEDLPLRELKSK